MKTRLCFKIVVKILLLFCFEVNAQKKPELPKEFNVHPIEYPRTFFHEPHVLCDTLKNGYWVQYYEDSGINKKLGRIWKIENGVKVGKEIVYRIDQSVDFELYYRNGKRFATVSYFPSGFKKDSLIYSNNKGELYFKSWYQNGKVEIDGSFFQLRTYYENGQIKSEKAFDENGELNGSVKVFEKNGEVKYLGSWKNGNPIPDQFYKGRLVKYDKLPKKLKKIIRYKAV